MGNTTSQSCIFCKIISGAAPAEIYYEDDRIMIFKDIKPASQFHYLAIPKEHIENVKSLTRTHIELVEYLVGKGREVLLDKGGNVDDVLFGFHLPPFNSVSHLHLHVISPRSEMSAISRRVFQPQSWWFATAEQILDQLNSKY